MAQAMCWPQDFALKEIEIERRARHIKKVCPRGQRRHHTLGTWWGSRNGRRWTESPTGTPQ